jgi:cell wall-associated NlpC family hydrolase
LKALAGSSAATWRPASPDSSTARPERAGPRRFALDGPTRHPDRRTHAYRNDIADIALAGQVFAPHYAAAIRDAVTAEAVMVRAAPDASAVAVSQLVRGEGFDVLDVAGDWAWGACGHDGYVGYVPCAALGSAIEPAHRVIAPAAPLFAAADIKSPVLATWPIGACFIGDPVGDFVAAGEGFVHRRHAAPIGTAEPDPVKVAERLIGQPYLWGGRGAGGIDCSGLVQVALGLCGIAAPRDSDLQRESLGEELADGVALRRGDLIFFPGHVGLMTDGERLIHANAFAMAVTIEPLTDVAARIDAAAPILARRRLQ